MDLLGGGGGSSCPYKFSVKLAIGKELKGFYPKMLTKSCTFFTALQTTPSSLAALKQNKTL